MLCKYIGKIYIYWRNHKIEALGIITRIYDKNDIWYVEIWDFYYRVYDEFFLDDYYKWYYDGNDIKEINVGR